MKALLAFLLATACSEPTLMKVCEVEGVFYYPQDSAAKNCPNELREIRWPGMPLKVWAGLGSLNESETYARSWWADEMGHEMFVQAMNINEAQIVVQFGSGRGFASTYHQRVGEVLSAVVELNGLGDVGLVAEALEHEYGHVLGLAHDRILASIMYPFCDSLGLMSESPPTVLDQTHSSVLSGADKDALEKLYFSVI